jgi:hypothetical protein
MLRRHRLPGTQRCKCDIQSHASTKGEPLAKSLRAVAIRPAEAGRHKPGALFGRLLLPSDELLQKEGRK